MSIIKIGETNHPLRFLKNKNIGACFCLLPKKVLNMMNQLFYYIYRIPVPLVLPIIVVIVLIWGLAMRFLRRRSPKTVKIINCVAAAVALVGILYYRFPQQSGKAGIDPPAVSIVH